MKRPIAWPMVNLDTADLYDEEIGSDLGYREYLTAPLEAHLSAEEYRTHAVHLVEADRRGEPSDDIAALLLVDGSAPLGKEPGRGVRGKVANIDALCSISTEHQPSNGADIPDLVLGPWVEELDNALPNHRKVLKVVTGMGTFMTTDGVPFSPWHRVRREKPRPSQALRTGIWSIWEAPMSLYRIVGQSSEGTTLRDVLGVRSIDAPVTILKECVANLFSGEPIAYYGRVVLTERGHEMVVGLALDALPDDLRANRWFCASLHRRRLNRRSMTRAMHQRDYAHQLARYLFAWRWAEHPNLNSYEMVTSTK
jgi:hypothetical protein